MPDNPGVGTLGRKIALTTNFFEVTALPTADLQMYSVRITPATSKDVNRRVLACLREAEGGLFEGTTPAYDGRLYIRTFVRSSYVYG
jgi:hypothetical protein